MIYVHGSSYFQVQLWSNSSRPENAAESQPLNLMAESKDEPKYHHTFVVEDPQESDTKAGEIKDGKKKKEKSKRLDSLDIFRGLTVVMMILVDDAGGEWPAMAHTPWNGCNLADFVMPFFLFIVGMAIPLALKRITKWPIALRKVIFRTLKLLFWGILLQGGYSHAPDDLTYGVDMKRVRWCGILQRIALAYLIVSGLEVANKNARGKSHPLGHLSVFKLYFCQWIRRACYLPIRALWNLCSRLGVHCGRQN